MQSQLILIVEDEAVVALDLKLQLTELGYTVTAVAASGRQAIDATEKQAPHLILMDVRLQGSMDGIEAAQHIRRRHPIPIIFLTSHSDDDTVQRAAQTAPYGYLTKPYQIKELRAGIEVALTKARLERQLQEADRWFAHTLQCVADGVVLTNLDGTVRFLNPAAEALTGWRLEDASGRGVSDVVQVHDLSGAMPHGLPRVETASLVAGVLRDGRPTPVAHGLRLVAREGTHSVVDATAGPVNDDAGQRLGAVVVLRDAGERVAQEALLRASEERFRTAFDHAPLGMALVSFAGEFMQVNDALCRLLGQSREALVRTRQADVTLQADRDHEIWRLQDLLLSPKQVVQFEKRYCRPAGQDPVWTLVSVSLLHDAHLATCHLYQVHDLTEQKQAAQALAVLASERMQRQASELILTSKTDFLSRVSHEMRTPLNAVIGFSQLLQLEQSTADPSRTQLFAGHIRTAGAHLLALVEDLLDLNRMSQGSLKIDITSVALGTVVADALTLIEAQAQAHGITLVVRVAPRLQVMGNAQRLRQVVLNLMSNAVKYNRQGGTVTVGFAGVSGPRRAGGPGRSGHGHRHDRRTTAAAVPALRTPGRGTHQGPGHRPGLDDLAQSDHGNGRHAHGGQRAEGRHHSHGAADRSAVVQQQRVGGPAPVGA